MTSLIRPHFPLLALPLLLFLLQSGTTSVSARRQIAAFAGGLSIPIGATFLYLLCTGSLGHFIDMAINYWPLHTHMTGGHTPISGLRRLLYIITSTVAGLATFYAPMAVIGLAALDGSQSERRHAWVIGGVLVAAALYPALSGQFWGYHWIPFYYVALCAASLPARVLPIKEWSIGGIAPTVGVIFLLLFLSSLFADQLREPWKKHDGGTHRRSGVPDEVSQFLRSHMNQEDTVQPLDWTGGAVHGMLMARAPLATRFMYDYHFYHHISSAYIGKLRRDFMSELVVRKPRFVIQVLENKPWPTGPDTTRDFPELQAFLEQHYASAQQGLTYRILQRIDDVPSKALQPTGNVGG